jgi:hypothetical protein
MFPRRSRQKVVPWAIREANSIPSMAFFQSSRFIVPTMRRFFLFCGWVAKIAAAAKHCATLQPLSDGITFVHPVGRKVVRQNQNAQTRETHSV